MTWLMVDLLLNEEIDSADYKSIKSAGERKIADLENKLFAAGRMETNIGPMLDKVFKTLSNLEILYKDGDLKTKRKIIGSIFPEKLVFNGNNQTARVNEAVELIYNVGQGFSENKNGQTEVNFDLSTQVNRIGQISNHFIYDLKKIAAFGNNLLTIPPLNF